MVICEEYKGGCSRLEGIRKQGRSIVTLHEGKGQRYGTMESREGDSRKGRREREGMGRQRIGGRDRRVPFLLSMHRF